MSTGKKVTLSIIKADVGGLAGHHVVHPDLI
ncbi:fructose 1,6-bisphosphatase, partial [Fervidicoccus fontis]